MTAENHFPKLRAVEVRQVDRGGWPSIQLRDPLGLTDSVVIVPQYLAPVLLLCDGTRDADALTAAAQLRYGLPLDRELLQELMNALDQALLLDNQRYAQARDQALAVYRQAPFRPPALAGHVYPADPDELRRLLRGYLDDVDDDGPAPTGGTGLVSPHIDYARGGPVYAAVWKRAAAMARAADLVVLLGTDHKGEVGQITLTRQHYATPFGVLPTAREIVDALAQALGAGAAFDGELRHRDEHSIELAAVWLHYIRDERPCEIVPILCGSFAHFVSGAAEPAQDPALNALLGALAQAAAGRQVLVVAAGDLSHVGSAFSGPALDGDGRAQFRAADDELIGHMCAGDAEGFFGALRQAGDKYNVCGGPPIYLALRMLGRVKGQPVAYDSCPADEHDTSAVSVCGVVFQ